MSRILYHCVQARSFRVLWMLEELGLDYDLRVLPFPPRVAARDYLDVNPLGTVPYYVEGDVRMTESAMICHWLATRHAQPKLWITPDEPGHSAYLNFVSYGEATLRFPLAVLFRYTQVEPPERRQTQAAEDYKRFFAGRLKLIDSVLAMIEWLCGDRFTAADVSVGYALRFARTLRFDELLKPQVKDYLDRIEARDAFVRAVLQESTR